MQTASLFAGEGTVAWGYFGEFNCRELNWDDLVFKGQGGLRSTLKASEAVDLSALDISTLRSNTLVIVMAWDRHQ